MAIRLTGSTAVVTGASSGIGRATVRALHEEGASVALLARREAKLTDLARWIRDEGGRAHVIETDITDESQARGAVHEAASALGGIDVLVNNAGLGRMEHVLEASVQDWRSMLDTNVMGLAAVHPRGAAVPAGVRRGAARCRRRRQHQLGRRTGCAHGQQRLRGDGGTVGPSASRCARKSPDATCEWPWSNRAWSPPT